MGSNGLGMAHELLLGYIPQKCGVNQALLDIDGESYRHWLPQREPDNLNHIVPLRQMLANVCCLEVLLGWKSNTYSSLRNSGEARCRAQKQRALRNAGNRP